MLIGDFLKNAADSTGFARESYTDKKLPHNPDLITVVTFFGDLRGELLFSTLFASKLRKFFQNQYVIICTHSGRSSIYTLDEVWGVKDDELLRDALGFSSSKGKELHFTQLLNRYFKKVYSGEELLKKYYNNGFLSSFFTEGNSVEVSLPNVISPKIDFTRKLLEHSGLKVFIHPSRHIHTLDEQGRERLLSVKIEFWEELGEKLLASKCTPVFHFHPNAHDLSEKFHDRAIICDERNLSGILACCRATGCVLDVFNNTFSYAAWSRTPLVWCEGRKRYFSLNVHELEDLVFPRLPRQIYYAFPDELGKDLIGILINRLRDFIPSVDRENLPGTSQEVLECDYQLVRKKRKKSLKLLCRKKERKDGKE